MNPTELRTRILLTLQNSLLGFVTSNMRSVLVAWSDSEVRIRIFFEGAVNADDTELASEIETQVISHLPDHRIVCDAFAVAAGEKPERLEGEALVFQRARD